MIQFPHVRIRQSKGCILVSNGAGSLTLNPKLRPGSLDWGDPSQEYRAGQAESFCSCDDKSEPWQVSWEDWALGWLDHLCAGRGGYLYPREGAASETMWALEGHQPSEVLAALARIEEPPGPWSAADDLRSQCIEPGVWVFSGTRWSDSYLRVNLSKPEARYCNVWFQEQSWKPENESLDVFLERSVADLRKGLRKEKKPYNGEDLLLIDLNEQPQRRGWWERIWSR